MTLLNNPFALNEHIVFLTIRLTYLYIETCKAIYEKYCYRNNTYNFFFTKLVVKT